MIGYKCTSSDSVRPSPSCTCLVLERGHRPAHEFIADFPELEALARSQFQDSEIVIVVRTPNGALNSIGCEPHQLIGVISDSFKLFNIKNSRWGVLCSPLIAVPTMGLLSGAYDRFRDGSAVAL